MKPVTIYTTPICPYCVRAKSLLGKKGVAYEEVDVMMDSKARDEMLAKSSGARTVPQIFIGDTHVGGCDELMPWNATASWIRCCPDLDIPGTAPTMGLGNREDPHEKIMLADVALAVAEFLPSRSPSYHRPAPRKAGRPGRRARAAYPPRWRSRRRKPPSRCARGKD